MYCCIILFIPIFFQYKPLTFEKNVTNYYDSLHHNFSGAINVTSGFNISSCYKTVKSVSIFSKLILLDLLPYIVIIVLNGIIVKTIFKSSKRICHLMVSLIFLLWYYSVLYHLSILFLSGSWYCQQKIP